MKCIGVPKYVNILYVTCMPQTKLIHTLKCMHVGVSVCLLRVSVCLYLSSIYLPVNRYPSIHLSVYPSIRLSSIVYPSIHLSLALAVALPLCLSLDLSLPISISISIMRSVSILYTYEVYPDVYMYLLI